MTHTAEQITADALAYNGEYPEAAAEILAGTPVVRVYLESLGLGWEIRAVVAPGIIAEDGGWIDAGERTAKRLRRRDGRLSEAETAKRATRYLGISEAAVPVEFIKVGRV